MSITDRNAIKYSIEHQEIFHIKKKVVVFYKCDHIISSQTAFAIVTYFAAKYLHLEKKIIGIYIYNLISASFSGGLIIKNHSP